uniref:F-box protein AT5G49610-like beta-propeller domain-containing protein n=1 Tax=Triticum urartu TaxID=4572 RepID=A0A8R7R927_TRIUA
MSPPPPTQRGCNSPPGLVDGAMREIFKRVLPDDSRSLVRATAVCTSWHGILSDADFAREYRAFHGAPPVLGFLHNTRHKRPCEKGRIRDYEKEHVVSNFVSTASFRPPACHERRHWRVLDSGHGLVLFHTPKRDEDFAICDLVTGRRWGVKADPDCADIIWNDWSEEDEDEGITWNAAVLCAKDGCHHIYCHGGPFLVALVGSDEEKTFATVYSSKTRKWSDIVSGEEPHAIETTGHTVVVGNKVYFPCEETDSLVEYDMAGQKLSVIALAEEEDDDLPWLHLMGVEDGMLMLATVMNFTLCLWSMEAGPSKTAVWVRVCDTGSSSSYRCSLLVPSLACRWLVLRKVLVSSS